MYKGVATQAYQHFLTFENWNSALLVTQRIIYKV